MVSIQAMLKEVLAKVTPTKSELEKEKQVAETLMNKINSIKGKHIGTELVGSISRNTHLRGDRDIDIFVFYPENLSRKEFEKEGLRIGKLAFKGHECWEEYSEHPYIKGIINGFEIEIVPSYKVKKASELKSAVDRSPFHKKFLEPRLKDSMKQDVRLLKAFLKGVDCYGARIEKEGFSGYLTEIIILKYGSFDKTLKGISEWKPGIALSLTGKGKSFDAPLTFIDPTDSNRNVAAALSEEQFARVVAAARAFLEKPGKNFFYPTRKSSISKKHMKKLIAVDQTFALRMPFPGKALSDVIWGQMRRFRKLLRKELECSSFNVRRISLFAEEGNGIDYFVELEQLRLNDTVICIGPHAWDKTNSEAFAAKHKRALTGPRIENDRWVVEEKRRQVDSFKLAKEFVNKRKKIEKKPFSKALAGTKFLEKKEFLKTAKRDKFFNFSLSKFLEGKESFL